MLVVAVLRVFVLAVLLLSVPLLRPSQLRCRIRLEQAAPSFACVEGRSHQKRLSELGTMLRRELSGEI